MRFGQEAMFCLLPFVFELLLSYKQREHITVAALCFLIMHVPVPGKGMPDLSMKGRNDLMRKEQDLTTGNVSKKLIKFAVPLLLANLLQSFYSIMEVLSLIPYVSALQWEVLCWLPNTKGQMMKRDSVKLSGHYFPSPSLPHY